MGWIVARYLFSAVVVVPVSEAARRSDRLGVRRFGIELL